MFLLEIAQLVQISKCVFCVTYALLQSSVWWPVWLLLNVHRRITWSCI